MISMQIKRKKLVDLDSIIKRLQTEKEVVVGFPKNNQNAYPDGTSVASVAYINEYGSTAMKIPSRPFMKLAMRRNKDKYKQMFKTGTQKILEGKSTTEKVLREVGLEAKNDIQMEITKIQTPPNASSTIKRKLKEKKGKVKVLIDSGKMRQAVSYEVRKKEKGK